MEFGREGGGWGYGRSVGGGDPEGDRSSVPYAASGSVDGCALSIRYTVVSGIRYWLSTVAVNIDWGYGSQEGYVTSLLASAGRLEWFYALALDTVVRASGCREIID